MYPFDVRDCGSLNENGPHRLVYLSAWSIVGRTVLEGLGGVALLEKVCHWLDFEFPKAHAITSLSPLLLVDKKF